MSDLTDAEVDEILKKERAIGEAFSPAAPVTDRDLFAGRTTQIRQLIDLVATAASTASSTASEGWARPRWCHSRP